jgi:hypothetical protein
MRIEDFVSPFIDKNIIIVVLYIVTVRKRRLGHETMENKILGT